MLREFKGNMEHSVWEQEARRLTRRAKELERGAAAFEAGRKQALVLVGPEMVLKPSETESGGPIGKRPSV